MKALYLLLLFSCTFYAQDFEKVRDSLKIKYKHIGTFKNGYASATNKTNKTGLIDSLGNEIIPTTFDTAEFSNNAVIISKNRRYGLYSLKNEQIIPIENEWLIPRNNNLFLIRRKNKHGIIDNTGTLILPLQYESATIYDERFIIARETSGMSTIFDPAGKQIQPFNYKIYALYKDVAFCSDGAKCSLVNLNHPDRPKLLDIDAFEEHGIFDYEQRGYHVFKKAGKYGLISYRGDILISAEYDELIQIHAITEEFIAKKHDMYGIINFRNTILAPFDYKKYEVRKEYLILKDDAGKATNHSISFNRKDLP